MLLENRGRRISLRAVEPDDAEWLTQAYAAEEFARLYRANADPASTEQIHEQLAERSRHDPAETGCIEFVILHPGDGRVGVVALVDYSPLHCRAELLVGIVGGSHRHSYVAVEATLLTLDLAFNHYGLNKLYTYVYEYNPYAEKNTLKIGFRQEGRLRHHHYCRSEKRFVDLYLNGMTLDDFRSSRPVARLSERLLGRNITAKPTLLRLDARDVVASAHSGALLEFLQSRAPN